jgi:predicted MPP superfamily phosphohydrolase
MHPDELLPTIPILKRLNAADGVFSVLGNHDYGDYLRADSATTKHNHQLMLGRQEEMGWHLLLDENFTVRRGGDSIFIAGMHNDGKVPIPTKGDPDKAMAGVPQGAFTIMLEHDPASWQRTVLPRTTAQLTLSGHTHGGQVNIAGVSPAAITCNEYDGMYEAASGRALFVTTGISGFVPFRIGLKPEVVVITLHRKN